MPATKEFARPRLVDCDPSCLRRGSGMAIMNSNPVCPGGRLSEPGAGVRRVSLQCVAM